MAHLFVCSFVSVSVVIKVVGQNRLSSELLLQSRTHPLELEIDLAQVSALMLRSAHHNDCVSANPAKCSRICSPALTSN